MRMIIIADPLVQLKPAGDTSLAFARGAAARGWDVYWCEAKSIWLQGTKPRGICALWKSGAAERPEVHAPQPMLLEDADVILIRPDPPFDIQYISLCWFLDTLAQRVVISNPPRALVQHHEKLTPWQMVDEGVIPSSALVPTCVTRSRAPLAAFAAELPVPEYWIVKPWLGYGGNGVERYATLDEAALAVDALGVPQMVQPFLPEIFTEGDRRVLIVEGRVEGHIVRLPAAEGFRANLAQGGSAVDRPMSTAQAQLCEKIGQYLVQQGIDFAGIDLVGSYVTEVNITSPTGVMAVKKMQGHDAVTPYLNLLERRVAALRKD